ncbi:hypothetical protein BDQ17DRAFT_25316 [Cyathus striatus]|nr:hypothetical protein BDQ17DRAFT_25316 [Cyathus striatus]
MFIPRTDGEADNCPVGYSTCTPTFAIVGTDPTEKETTEKNTGPSDYEKPGPHRYIGIGMVIGMAFIVFVLWWTFAKWPRRMRRKHFTCWRRRSSGQHSAVTGERKLEAVVIQTPSLPEKRMKSLNHDSGLSSIEKPTRIAAISQRTKSLDDQKGLADWEIGHVQGIRYETRTPRHDGGHISLTKPPRVARR